MIVNQLYPDGSTWWTGETYQQYLDIASQSAAQIGYDVFSPENYWLGWISSDNLTVYERMSHCEIDGDIYTFIDDTDSGNFPLTYVITNRTQGCSFINGHLVTDTEDTSQSYYSDYRFINQLYPTFCGFYSYGNITISGIGFIYTAGNTFELKSAFTHANMVFDPVNIISNWKNFIKFYEYAGTFTINFGNTYGTISGTRDDFKTGEFWAESSTGYNVHVFFTGYGVPGNHYIWNQNNYTRINGIYPFVSVTCSNCDGVTSYGKVMSSNFEGYPLAEIPYSPNTFRWIYDEPTTSGHNPGRTRAGMHGVINTSLLHETNPYSYDGNVLCTYKLDRNRRTFEFYPIISLDDIYKSFSLRFRMDTQTFTRGYVNGITYATDVTPQNEFLARLKTGDIEDPEFKNSLRPWQYENFQENDFTEDDIPPYVPPSPTPGGDTPPDEPQDLPHDDGNPAGLQERSLGVPSQFITQYALTASEVQAIGVNLWTSWLTPNTDVWKNFFLPYANDFGTLNIGAALDFIISLRAYPFELPLDVLLPAPDGVRMGTGHTDFLGSSCAMVKTSIMKLSLGSCEVKLPQPYNDFRDMYNTSVVCHFPYCGTVELNPAEVMNRTLYCYYLIDFQSGGCTAVLELAGDAGNYIIASKSGQIGFLLPMTATNAGQLAAQAAQDAVQTVGTLSGFFFDVAGAVTQSTENIAKAMLGNEMAQQKADFKGTEIQPWEQKQVPVGMTATSSLHIGQSGVNTALELANQTLTRLSRSGINVPMLSGGSGAEAMFMPDTAIIQIRRGKYAKPANYPHSQGFLNGSSGKIRDYAGKWSGSPSYPDDNAVGGLCKFTGVDTTGLTCTSDERAEILALLESGVYV